MVKSSLTMPHTASPYKLDMEVYSAAFQDSHYHSILTVTGVLLGVYQYSVTNRATPGMVTDQMNIGGTLAKNTAYYAQ